MKISEFLYENFQFLEVKFSIYLNRCVFVMKQERNKAGTYLLLRAFSPAPMLFTHISGKPIKHQRKARHVAF